MEGVKYGVNEQGILMNSDESTPLTGEVTPLPWTQVLILLAVRLADPLSFTVLFPFVYFMVRDFHLTDKDGEIGYCVGLVASSYAVTQMMSVSLFMFGMSKSLPWAILTRSVCGLLTGNVGVIKSTMAELTDRTNRGKHTVDIYTNIVARGFSMLPLAGGVGTVLGPILGGFLANPVDKYPGMFRFGWSRLLFQDLFREYPYLLPCMACSSITGVSFVLTYFYFEETVGNELIPREDSYSSTCSTMSKPRPIGGFFRSIPRESWVAAGCFAFMSFQTVIQSELTPLWAATPAHLGGLGFNTSEIGVLMSFSGISLLVIQLSLYAPAHNKFGTLLLYRNSFPFYMCAALMFPLVSMLVDSKYDMLVWPSLLFCTSMRSGASVFIKTSVNLITVEACPSRRMLGKINGISQTSASIMKAIGPAFCGLVFSWSLQNHSPFPFLRSPLIWELLSLFAFLNYLLTFHIFTWHYKHQSIVELSGN